MRTKCEVFNTVDQSLWKTAPDFMLKSEEHCQPSALQSTWNDICLVQTDPWPFQAVMTKVKLLPTVLRVHLLHGNKGKISKVYNEQQITTHRKNTVNIAVEQWLPRGSRYVTLFVVFSLSPSAKQVNCDIPGLLQQEYFSYICFQISTNVLDYSY